MIYFSLLLLFLPCCACVVLCSYVVECSSHREWLFVCLKTLYEFFFHVNDTFIFTWVPLKGGGGGGGGRG